MGTTRRGFLGGVLGLLSAPAAALAARKERVEVEPGLFGRTHLDLDDFRETERLKNALLKVQLEEAYLRAHPVITIDAPQMNAVDLKLSPGRIVSAIDVEPNPDPLFRLLGRED